MKNSSSWFCASTTAQTEQELLFMLTISHKPIKKKIMIQYTKYCLVVALLLVIGSCKKKEYSMGNLTAPSEVTINTTIAGQDATHPNGDGSGDVNITLTGKNVLSYN